MKINGELAKVFSAINKKMGADTIVFPKTPKPLEINVD